MQIQNNPYQNSLYNIYNSGNSAQSPYTQMCQQNMPGMTGGIQAPPSDAIGLVGYLANQISQLAQGILSLFGSILGSGTGSSSDIQTSNPMNGFFDLLKNLGGSIFGGESKQSEKGSFLGSFGSTIGKFFGGLFS